VSNRRASNFYFVSDFDADDEYRADWPTGDVGGLLEEFGDGLYHLSSSRPSIAQAVVFKEDQVFSSVSISMVGRLQEDSNPSGAYGIVFRYQDEDHYNVFAVDGRGRYSIWVRSDGIWTELRDDADDWTPDPAINVAGTDNRLTIDILGNNLTGYVNAMQVVRVTDDTLPPGNIGIYLATHTSGITDVLVDEYQTYPVAPPSMTGG
jgi:hypothetical protein